MFMVQTFYRIYRAIMLQVDHPSQVTAVAMYKHGEVLQQC